MPLLGLAHILIALTFVIHAMRTGRNQFWPWVIIMLPVLGSLAYVVVELLPELAQTRRARKVKSQISDIIAPDREWQRLSKQVQQTGSVEAKQALAEEAERKGMWAEAADLYRSAATGLYEHDPKLLIGLARSQLGAGAPQSALDTLDALQKEHPDIESGEAHLCYARSQEALGRLAEAAEEYRRLSAYYIGLEARTRYGLLLIKLGQPDQARTIFKEIVSAGSARGVVLSDADRDWLKVAKANI